MSVWQYTYNRKKNCVWDTFSFSLILLFLITIIIIIIIRVFCPRAGPSLEVQEGGLQFCRRQVFHRKLRNQGCSFTRDEYVRLLSAPHSLFIIWSDLKRSVRHLFINVVQIYFINFSMDVIQLINKLYYFTSLTQFYNNLEIGFLILPNLGLSEIPKMRPAKLSTENPTKVLSARVRQTRMFGPVERCSTPLRFFISNLTCILLTYYVWVITGCSASTNLVAWDVESGAHLHWHTSHII